MSNGKTKHASEDSLSPKNGRKGGLEQLSTEFCSIKDQKTWEASTPAEKRVAIALDVKARIGAKKVVAKNGLYLLPGMGPKMQNLNQKIDEEEMFRVAEGTQKCQACAKGSLFIAALGYDKTLRIPAVKVFSDPSDSLRHIFKRKQLDLIETAFEKRVIHGSPTGEETAAENRAITFGKKFKSAESRLLAICDNIIENKGTFVP